MSVEGGNNNPPENNNNISELPVVEHRRKLQVLDEKKRALEDERDTLLSESSQSDEDLARLEEIKTKLGQINMDRFDLLTKLGEIGKPRYGENQPDDNVLDFKRRDNSSNEDDSGPPKRAI